MFSLIPNILLGYSGGRHTLIIIFGFIIVFYYFLLYFKNYWKKIFLFFFILGLIISQGNAWTQVVASRISGSIYGGVSAIIVFMAFIYISSIILLIGAQISARNTVYLNIRQQNKQNKILESSLERLS